MTPPTYGVVSHTLITTSKLLQADEPSSKRRKKSSLLEAGYVSSKESMIGHHVFSEDRVCSTCSFAELAPERCEVTSSPF